MKHHFTDRLIEEIEAKRAPCVVGLDTALEALPPEYLAGLDLEKEAPRRVYAETMIRFNKMVIDEIADLVPAVKPNAAFYEKYGADGFFALEETIAYARSKGLIVILDAKRGDIGNTAAAYANAFLSQSKLPDHAGQNADALTVNPYLGEDSLEPFVEILTHAGTGIFVLVRTSNKGATTFQDLEVGNKKLYEKVAETVVKLGIVSIGQRGYSAVGAVVGATWPKDAVHLREQMPKTFFLVPGFGAQGGDVETVKACFDKNGLGAIVNSSRGVLYPKSEGNSNYRESIRAACEKFVYDVRKAIGW